MEQIHSEMKYEKQMKFKLSGVQKFLNLLEADHRKSISSAASDKPDMTWVPDNMIPKLNNEPQRPKSKKRSRRRSRRSTSCTSNASFASNISQNCSEDLESEDYVVELTSAQTNDEESISKISEISAAQPEQNLCLEPSDEVEKSSSGSSDDSSSIITTDDDTEEDEGKNRATLDEPVASWAEVSGRNLAVIPPTPSADVDTGRHTPGRSYWTYQRDKHRRKPNNSGFRNQNRISSSSWLKKLNDLLPATDKDNEKRVTEEVTEPADSLTTWTLCSQLGDYADHLEHKLKKKRLTIKVVKSSLIEALWYLWEAKDLPKTDDFPLITDCESMEMAIKKSIRKSKEPFNEDSTCRAITKILDFNIRVISSRPSATFSDIKFSPVKRREIISKVIILAHITGRTFAVLKHNESSANLELPDDISDRLFVSHVISQPYGIHNDQHFKDSIHRIHKLQSKLDGLQKDDLDCTIYPIPPNRSQIYTQKPFSNSQKTIYKTCILHLDDAHRGHAIPVGSSSDADRIELIGRVHCGRAFEKDRVTVEVFNNSLGRVVNVLESEVRPINQLFLCQVCSDQTSLMRPMCRTFPKIHVNNRPAEEFYSNQVIPNLTSIHQRVRTGMASADDEERLNRRYADKLFVSLYDIKVNNGKVFCRTSRNCIIRVNRHDCRMLFIVRYEKWDPMYLYPFGQVVGVIEETRGLQQALPIVQMLCQVPLPIEDKTFAKEIKEIRRKLHLVAANVKDLRKIPTVTIDNITTRDIDDALSAYQDKQDENIKIGVHITDVTEFVAKDTLLDKEARRRGLTFYPPNGLSEEMRPINMLPDSLSEDWLSLNPEADRRAISINLEFSCDGKKLIRSEICESVISSNWKLAKEDVKTKIREGPEKLKETLRLLFLVGTELRNERLKEEAAVVESESSIDTFESEAMIEEFMVFANKFVGEFLHKVYPDNSLFRNQRAPSSETVKNFLQNLGSASDFSGRFTRLKNHPISSNENSNVIASSNEPSFSISEDMHADLVDCVEKGDFERGKKLILSENRFPSVSISLHEWFMTSEKAFYSRYDVGHFSLNIKYYSKFTSPIRSFANMVVHRLVKAALRKDTIPPYTELELDEIAEELNRIEASNNRYERFKNAITSASKVATDPQCMPQHCTLYQSSLTHLELIHPKLSKCLMKSVAKIKMADLCLSKAPELKTSVRPSERGPCILTWQERIFQMGIVGVPNNKTVNTKAVTLCSHLNEWSLPNSPEKALRKLRSHSRLDDIFNKKVSKERKSQLTSLCDKFMQCSHTEPRPHVADINWEVTGEYNVQKSSVLFDMTLSSGDTIKIHWCPKSNVGWPEAKIQRIEFSNSFSVCLEHREDPAHCFCSHAFQESLQELPPVYQNLKQYRQRMLPVMHMEVATEAVQDSSAFVCHGVKVDWIVDIKQKLWGVAYFCPEKLNERQIRFGKEEKHSVKRGDQVLSLAMNEAVSSDFICVRIENEGKSKWWNGHGEVIRVNTLKAKKGKETSTLVIFRIESLATALPQDLLQEKCSLEFLHKTISSRRQESIIESLIESDFPTQVILGRILLPTKYEEEIYALKKLNELLTQKSLPFLNGKQKEAVFSAFRKPFSLIWGPPGTGKTWTGCLLAYAYTCFNQIVFQREVASKQDSPVKKQVLYCGPSNDSVNVVADALLRKLDVYCPKIVRVYGEQVEINEFAIPGETENFSRNKTDVQVPGFLKNISLHHIIRESGKPYADIIREFDDLFSRSLNDERLPTDPFINKKLTDKYHSYLSKAKREELNNFEVILCTTSVSASPTIRDTCQFAQIIIDEAGMCKEPEVLVPLAVGATSKHCKNVVLIGDHKQLRPIIINNLACQLGLQISLFERYARLNPMAITMLTHQYRMHPSICEFSSGKFYDGQLITRPNVTWTGVHLTQILPEFRRYWSGFNTTDVMYQNTKSYNDYDKMLKDNHVNVITDEYWPGIRPADSPFTSMPNVPLPDFGVKEHVVFVHVEGLEMVQTVATDAGSENSKANRSEVIEVVRIYKAMQENFDPPRWASEHITVLSQYRLQVREITRALNERGISQPKVSSVIRSQGSENDYVIFSTVRSLAEENINTNPTPGWERQYLGFITDPNQINVALTRAQKGLIIIGNSKLLKVNKMWNGLICNLTERGCFIPGPGRFLTNNCFSPTN